MDFIAEFIFEVVLEGIFAVTVENPEVKTRVKTAVFLLITQFFTGLLTWITVDAWRQNNDGWIVTCIFAILWGIGMLIAAIYGHKKGWPNNG